MEKKLPNTNRKSENLQDIFASNVLFYRKKLDISQEQLAERCNYHRTYVGSVERAERNVTLATIEAFSIVFNVEPYELLMPKNE